MRKMLCVCFAMLIIATTLFVGAMSISAPSSSDSWQEIFSELGTTDNIKILKKMLKVASYTQPMCHSK